MAFFKHRPKARFKLGQAVRGETFGGRAQGYVIYSEYDKADRRHYTWEEWEITGFKDYDGWIEYDHYTRKITAYETFKTDTDLDPNNVKAGDTTQSVIDGKVERLTVKEVGTATAVRMEGTLTHYVFVGEPLTYAEITYSNGVLSVEKYNNREYDVYKGRILSIADQKKMFGRRVQPYNLTWLPTAIIFAIIGLFMIGPSLTPSYENYCTPRTLVNSGATNNDEVVSQTADQTCYRRAIYGGGGGGIGK